MADNPTDKAAEPKRQSRSSNAVRQDRLKAALKANMARRKAQARARRTGEPMGQTDNKNTH